MWSFLRLYLITSCCILLFCTDTNCTINIAKSPPANTSSEAQSDDMSTAVKENVQASQGGQTNPAQSTNSENTEARPSSKTFPKDIITAMRRSLITFAEHLVLAIESEEEFEKVGADIYVHRSFDEAIELAVSVTTIEPTLYILKGVFDKIKEQDQQDPHQLIKLATVLQTDVINQTNCKFDTKMIGIAQLNKTLTLLKRTTLDFLTKAMKSDKYSRNSLRKKLCDELVVFRPDISADVMTRLINDTFDIVPLDNIIKNIQSHEYVPMLLSGLEALFWKFKEAGKINHEKVLEIGQQISKLEKTGQLRYLDDEWKENLDRLKANLPACIKNVLFEERVCIWNRASEEFLFVANETHNYDIQRRRVFTWSTGVPIVGSHWQVELTGKYVNFKNYDYHLEYIYAGDVNYNTELRHVFTWIPGGNSGTKVAWSIETNGDYCYLKNVHYGEYLFSSLLIMPQDMRSIFTWEPKSDGGLTEQFQWQIRKC